MARLLLLTILALITAILSAMPWRRLWNSLSEDRPDDAQPSSPTGLLLFLLPLPVAVAALISMAEGRLMPLLGDATGYGLFLAGALLVRRGLLSTEKAPREPWPLKTLGSVLIGLATGTTVWLGIDHPPAIGAAFALVALLGCYLTYGFDSYTRGRIGSRTRATLADAARSITAIEHRIHDIRQPEIEARLRRIVGLARKILKRIEEDPRDPRRARKFLNIYLDGVQSIVEGYAKTHINITSPDLDERFRRALIMIEDAFQEQQRALLESDLDHLDVQIEVLTQQLKRDGIL